MDMMSSIDRTPWSQPHIKLDPAHTHMTHPSSSTPQLQEAAGPTDDASASTAPTPTAAAEELEVHYSYREQAAYLTILYLVLVAAIAFFLLRYANRSLFRWHTVRFLSFRAIHFLFLRLGRRRDPPTRT